MVRQFKNRVRIADVQAEFDNLCSRIDNLNQRIQDVTDIGEEYDYSVGSNQLAPAGYTLTVGGLKKVLTAFDGMVIGAKAFRVNNTTVKLTSGILITSQGCYKIPSSLITIPTGFYSIYFDTSNNSVTTTATDYKVCDINLNRDSINATDNRAIQCENIYGTYDIRIPSRTYAGDWKMPVNNVASMFTWHLDWGNINAPQYAYEQLQNSSAAKFLLPFEAGDGNDRWYQMNFKNSIVLQGNYSEYRALNWYQHMNYTLIPKGVANPFTYQLRYFNRSNPDNGELISTLANKISAQKQYNVKISKKIKQKTS